MKRKIVLIASLVAGLLAALLTRFYIAAKDAEVKPAYATDPMAATRIAAVTQLVMCPKCDKAPAGRAVWTAALIKAAEASTDSYRTMFLLDQLRWCGKPEQADRILMIGAKAKDPAVKEFAAWTVRELRAM